MNEPWHEDAEKGWQLLSWQGEAQWFARQGDKVLGGRLRSLDALIGTIRNAEALEWNLYLNANPTRHVPGKKKLSRDDVTHWKYAVVDLDPGPDDVLQPPQTDGGWPEAASYLTHPEAVLRQAVCIFSGRGYQYWLPMEGPAEIGHLASSCTAFAEPVNPGAVEQAMAGYLRILSIRSAEWCPGWKVDPACSDLARVVRCPGSVNQRTGRRAEVVREEGRPIGRRVFADYAQHIPVVPREPVDRLPEDVNLLTLLPHLNVNARRFILGGAEEPGRHRACFATCKTLQELGVSARRSTELLDLGASYCVPQLQTREVGKIVEQVYGRAR